MGDFFFCFAFSKLHSKMGKKTEKSARLMSEHLAMQVTPGKADMEKCTWGNISSTGSSFFSIVPGDLLIWDWNLLLLVMEPVFSFRPGSPLVTVLHVGPCGSAWPRFCISTHMKLLGRSEGSAVLSMCPRFLRPAGCSQTVLPVLGRGWGLHVTSLAEVRCWYCC